jgi:hypothetical protein
VTNLKLSTFPETVFVNPVSDSEVERVIRNLKGTLSAGFDVVLDLVIKKCADLIKKPLQDIHNALFYSGSLPVRLKLAVIKPSKKKRGGGTLEI